MSEIQSASEVLRAAIEALGVNQAQFAKSIGFHSTHVGSILQGKCSISPQFAYAVQQQWGLNALDLLTTQSRHQLAKIAEQGLPDRRNPKHGNRVDIDEQEVVAAYVEDGVPVQLIADSLDVSYGTIWRILNKHEVPMEPYGPERRDRRPAMRPYRKVPPPIPRLENGELDEATIIARYEEGYSSAGIAEAVDGMTGPSILRLLHRRKVKVRPARVPTGPERVPGPPVKV